jgi:hypothetical protein
MSFRDNIFVQLRTPIPYFNRFMLGRSKEPSANTFMANRQKTYQGWHDRRAGYYIMSHNKHIKEE